MSIKKDILAAITFLVTGLVFAVAQMDGQKEDFGLELGQEECMVSETMNVQEAGVDLSPTAEPVSRDS